MAIAGKIIMRPMGEYNTSTVYDILDLVTYNNALWMCKAPSTVGVEPSESNTDKWQVVVNNVGSYNPNLLDNWYFKDPVNQRNQSGYTGSGYSIDRWTIIESDGVANLDPNGLKVTKQLRQYIENPKDVFGREVTGSVLLADGTLVTGTMTTQQTDGGQIIADNDTVHIYMYVAGESVSFIIECRSEVQIQAVKLEFGNKQTLTKVTGGIYVLNDTPPNKSLEMFKCSCATDDPADTYANKTMQFV